MGEAGSVNRYFFKKPRLAGILVSIAGPFSNLVLAFIGLLIYYLMNNAAVDNDALYRFFTLFIQINLTLGVFNLLPFPPLDGYRVIEDLVPPSTRAKMTQYESWGIFVFLILVITPLRLNCDLAASKRSSNVCYEYLSADISTTDLINRGGLL